MVLGFLKLLIGRHGQPSMTSVAMALEAHAADMYHAIEQTYLDLGDPEKSASIRMAFKNRKLVRGMDRYPLYLTMLAVATAVRCGIEGREQSAVAMFALKEFTGMSDRQLQDVVTQHMHGIWEIGGRLREQMQTHPLILDSETVLLWEANNRGEELAHLLRENRNARLPVDREHAGRVILGIGEKDVVPIPIPDVDADMLKPG